MFKVNGVSVQLPNKVMTEDFQQFRKEGHSITHSLLLLAERKSTDKDKSKTDRGTTRLNPENKSLHPKIYKL